MKRLHYHFIHHLRSYRTFHFMFFTFVLLLTSLMIYFFGNRSYAAEDLLEQAFKPAMQQETVINLGAGKNAVGNEVLREGIVINSVANRACFVNNQRLSDNELEAQKDALGYSGNDSEEDDREFCETILGGDYRVDIVQTEAPLIVRIAKFFLRITMVLAVTMVIFNGIMRIIESAKGAEVKDAKKNITLIIVGILIALMSLGIINLISSLTVSSLGGGS